MHVITTYRLREGVDVDAFRELSRTVDRPACLAKPVCSRFDVYTVTGGSGAGPLPSVVESIEVTSLEAWEAATSGPDHAHIMKQWNEFALEETVVSIVCDPIAA
jgi:hypothetical protein